jgi:hypothetical protein
MPQADHKAHDIEGRAGGVVLAVCLIIIAGGATLPQRLAGMTNAISYSFAETLYGTVTASLLIVGCVWLALARLSRRDGRGYRLAGVEIGLAVFVVAGLVSILLASDKRAAINQTTFIAAPIFMAAMLVQVLTSAARIKVLLYTVAALGIVNTYECANQFFESNDATIQEYDKNPEAALATVGIQPGTYEHMMFEYHLKSKDVRGFFTTSNSAGSFMLLAVFASLALVVEGYCSTKTGGTTLGEMVGKCIVLAITCWGLWLTQSKGAIGAAAIAILLLLLWRLSRGWLARHKVMMAGVVVVTILVVVAAIVAYGTKHGTLPGGKSMMVRWQYWVGAGRMYAEHPLGVGGGNFYAYYPQYKMPAAPETPKDPHNFILSFLTQYGPLGMSGFLIAILGPVWLVIYRRSGVSGNARMPADNTFGRLSWRLMLLVAVALLLIRPLVVPYETGTQFGLALFIISWLFVLPVLLFAGTFVLTSLRDNAGPYAGGAQAVLLCGIAGVLIHNCIDFAIFEPGVMLAFWAFIGAFAAVATASEEQPIAEMSLPGGDAAVWLGTAAAAALLLLCVVLPASRVELCLERSNRAVQASDTSTAHMMLADAARIDTLNAEPSYEDGRLYLFEYSESYPEPNLIRLAETAMLTAIARNPAYYKYPSRLADVYSVAAQTARGSQRENYLRKALAVEEQAAARYPGDSAIHISLGDIADKLGMTQEAVKQYKMAVAIEDDYRTLFAVMYPSRQLYSRVGEKQYQWARTRIVELGGKTD